LIIVSVHICVHRYIQTRTLKHIHASLSLDEFSILHTHVCVHVQFLITAGMELPSNWDPMPVGEVCHMVTLDDKSKEYREVKALFEVSVPVTRFTSLFTSSSRDHSYSIIKIQRIQNPQLYRQYVTRKKGMDQHNNPSFKNERRLFHGCPKDIADLISHQGFNRSFAGKNGNNCIFNICTYHTV